MTCWVANKLKMVMLVIVEHLITVLMDMRNLFKN